MSSTLCQQCNRPFKAARSTARYCSQACRIAAHRCNAKGKKPESGTQYRTALKRQKSPPQVIENIEADVTLNRQSEKGSKTPLRWVKVNDFIWKLTDGKKIKGWIGRHEERALAWLMGVSWSAGRIAWEVRRKDQSYGPTTLAKAKMAAEAMVAGKPVGQRVKDAIGHLNEIEARTLDQVAARVERVELIGEAKAIELEPLYAIPANTPIKLADSTEPYWDAGRKKWVGAA